MKSLVVGGSATVASIWVPESLKRRLAARREGQESLAKVIERVLDEDDEAHLPLSKQAKSALARGRRDIRAGRLKDIEQVRAEFGV